ncbi:MAG TPA: hypothetical protein P5524_02710, partial [Candidatus Paceibacterota bacterium]|nr:hypothetical protein [Candidatus Paceibacterota bacterium]
ALNLASEGNFAFLTAFQKRFRSFRKAWFSNINPTAFSDSRLEAATIQKFSNNQKKIDPEKEWRLSL